MTFRAFRSLLTRQIYLFLVIIVCYIMGDDPVTLVKLWGGGAIAIAVVTEFLTASRRRNNLLQEIADNDHAWFRPAVFEDDE